MVEDIIIAHPHVPLHTHYDNIETYAYEKEINLYLFK